MTDFLLSLRSLRSDNDKPEDALSDDNTENLSPIMLPTPHLGNLVEIENHIRTANATQAGRDALGKFVTNHNYISTLIPLVQEAEDLESIDDLHRLCSIMKIIILLNDTSIIEHVVTDDIVLGVVGALECRRYVAIPGIIELGLIDRRRPGLSDAQGKPSTVPF